MPSLYERYQEGFYQEVYNELMLMQNRVFESHIYEDAVLVARALMSRVKYNIEMIILRLRLIGYRFGEGFSQSPEEKAYWEQEAPMYRAPTPETAEHINKLEQIAGILPFTLKYCYTEVGSVNLVGTFPISEKQRDRIAYGSLLDPLFIYSVEMVLTMGQEDGGNVNDIPIAPDRYFKYGYSGGGPYSIQTPCKSFDAVLEGYEVSGMTFVNYLRLCFEWGGFPGLEQQCRLSRDELEYLTKDLLSF